MDIVIEGDGERVKPLVSGDAQIAILQGIVGHALAG